MIQQSFKVSLRVVWADTDAAQVVHYSNYFRFFERAEEEFYRSLGFTFADAAEKGLWFPKVEAFCQYKKPAKFNDLLQVELSVEELKEKSMRYGFRILNKETEALHATGYVVVVAVNRQTGKATLIPSEIRMKLEPYSK